MRRSTSGAERHRGIGRRRRSGGSSTLWNISGCTCGYQCEGPAKFRAMAEHHGYAPCRRAIGNGGHAGLIIAPTARFAGSSPSLRGPREPRSRFAPSYRHPPGRDGTALSAAGAGLIVFEWIIALLLGAVALAALARRCRRALSDLPGARRRGARLPARHAELDARSRPGAGPVHRAGPARRGL